MTFSLRRILRIALFSAIALTIFVLEGFIPPLVPIPGVKLGLSNCITLLVLVLFGPLDAALCSALRIGLGTLFTGQAVSLLYSLSGGLLCFLLMWLLSVWLQQKYLPLISVCGACAHNLGQILMAVLLTGTWSVAAYLPVLLISALVTGSITGLAVHLSTQHLRPFLLRHFTA